MKNIKTPTGKINSKIIIQNKNEYIFTHQGIHKGMDYTIHNYASWEYTQTYTQERTQYEDRGIQFIIYKIYV